MLGNRAQEVGMSQYWDKKETTRESNNMCSKAIKGIVEKEEISMSPMGKSTGI